jgi:hypothetical protein
MITIQFPMGEQAGLQMMTFLPRGRSSAVSVFSNFWCQNEDIVSKSLLQRLAWAAWHDALLKDSQQPCWQTLTWSWECRSCFRR